MQFERHAFACASFFLDIYMHFMLFDCVFHTWLCATFCLHELLTFVLPERLSQSQVVHRTLFWILSFLPVAASFSMTLEISPFSQKEAVMKLLVTSCYIVDGTYGASTGAS